MAFMCYAGDTAAGERVIAPFRALATPLADMVKPIPYAQMFPPEQLGYHPIASAHTLFTDGIDASKAARLLDAVKASTAMMAAVQFRVLGGAIAGIANDATAYGFRHQPMMINVAALYTNVADAPTHDAWIGGVLKILEPKDSSAYVNFIGAEGNERVRMRIRHRHGIGCDESSVRTIRSNRPAESEHSAGVASKSARKDLLHAPTRSPEILPSALKTSAFHSVRKRRDAGLRAAEDQRVHVVRAFVGVHDLEVDEMPDDAELVDDAVAAEHVARDARDVERLAAELRFSIDVISGAAMPSSFIRPSRRHACRPSAISVCMSASFF